MASSTGSTSSILGPNGTSNYMPGLVSGLDTEDMVEKLLSGTQAKIDKQNAKKQQIEWKQDIYRDIITKINGFTDKYFSFFGTGNTNLLSSSFYNVMTATSTNSAVKVSSATSRAPSSMVIQSISQLATASKGESVATVTGSLQGNINQTNFSADKTYSFDMSLDGVRKTIKFQGADNKQELIKNINDSMKRVYGNTVAFDENSMELKFTASGSASGTSTDLSHSVILYNTSDASDETVERDDVLKNLGFSDGSSNKLSYNSYLNELPFATKLQGKNYTFTINGTEIKATSEDTLGDVINRINNSEAEVKVTYSSVKDKFIIESANTGVGIDIKMEQSEGNLLSAMFGIQGGNTISGTTKGIHFTNSAQAGGNVDSTALQEYLDNSKNKSQTFSFYMTDPDGKENKYNISIPKTEIGSQDELIRMINQQLSEQFGTVEHATDTDSSGNPVRVPVLQLAIDSTTGKATFTGVQLNDDGKAVDSGATKGYQVSFTADNEDSTLAGILGFTKYDGSTQLSRLGLTGKIAIEKPGVSARREIDLTGKTIDQLMGELSYGTERVASFDPVTGKISIEGGLDRAKITAVNTDGKNAMNALFGTDALFQSQTIGSGFTFDGGQNAILEVNGTTIERNSNAFELDGITMELTATTAAGDPPISLTTSKDTDKIVEGLKSFVDDYNALIEELNDQISAEASYQKYAPLTDAQKKEMSEREIENWEKKAKEGLLRNDSNISKFLQEMRSVMYKTVDSAGIALYDIGIEASSNYKDNGKLVLDESKLKGALTTKLDEIQKMFTDKNDGLAVQLQKALKEAANPSSGSPGSLVRYAGTKDVMVTSNTLYYEMKSVKETLSRLNTKYETERTRYWKQFTAMEKAISNMNSQSSWLTQQFS